MFFVASVISRYFLVLAAQRAQISSSSEIKFLFFRQIAERHSFPAVNLARRHKKINQVKMTEKIVENHKIVTMEHEIRMEGRYLSEKKQKTWIKPICGCEQNEIACECEQTTITTHLRVIDGNSIKVCEVTKSSDPKNPTRTVETDMETQEEMDNFEGIWKSLWNPKITEKEIAHLH